MPEMPLTQGFVAVVDEDDWPLIARHKWSVAIRRETNSVRYYAQTFDGRTIVLMHRLIMGAQPGQTIDHVDGDGLNNRRSNLRLASTAENGANSRGRFCRSGYRGVHSNHKRWMARVGSRYVGTFDTPEQAAKARDEAARRVYGEFAVLNFPAEEAA